MVFAILHPSHTQPPPPPLPLLGGCMSSRRWGCKELLFVK